MMDRKRKVGGDPLIHQISQRGSLLPREPLGGMYVNRTSVADVIDTNWNVCFQTMANKLLIAAPMLRTREQNQKVFTIVMTGLTETEYDICSIVAVTPEKKVAPVDSARRTAAPRFCS